MKKIFLMLLSTVWVLNGNALKNEKHPIENTKKQIPSLNKEEMEAKNAIDQNPSFNEEVNHREKTPQSPSYMQYLQGLTKTVVAGSPRLENELDIVDVIKFEIAMAEDQNETAKNIANKGLYPWRRELLNRKIELRDKQNFIKKHSSALTKHEEIELKREMREVEEELEKVEQGLGETGRYYRNEIEEEFAFLTNLRMEQAKQAMNSPVKERQEVNPAIKRMPTFLPMNQKANVSAPLFVPPYSPNQKMNSVSQDSSHLNQSEETNPYYSSSSVDDRVREKAYKLGIKIENTAKRLKAEEYERKKKERIAREAEVNASSLKSSPNEKWGASSTSSPAYLQYMQNLTREVFGSSGQLEDEMEITEKIGDIVKDAIEKAESKKEKAKEIADTSLYPWKKDLLKLDLTLQTQMYDQEERLESLKETLERQKSIKSEKSKEIEELNDKIKKLEEAYDQTKKCVKSVEEIMLCVEKGLNATRKYYFNQEEERSAFSTVKKMEDMSPLGRMMQAMNNSMVNPDGSSSSNQSENPHVPSYPVPEQSARTNPYGAVSSNSGISRR